MKMQVTTLNFPKDNPIVWVDIPGSQDAEESLFSFQQHLDEGEDGTCVIMEMEER